ncbi:hypothetical protein F2Q70_00027172 [Brassica cretica]|uniref:Uncharacterized protein n=1 Tax=Brassica cretica TaxID=69181 RepID=A0A8S9LHR0_BRACR|nr:hypothetical protein F2Q70_00027172 [Brassica cretica]
MMKQLSTCHHPLLLCDEIDEEALHMFLTSETVLELWKPDWSRYQFVVLRLETMSGLKPRGGSSSCRSLFPQMPPASPIEDRGTTIPIEDRDRVIPERLRLCGVIVKGLPVSLV